MVGGSDQCQSTSSPAFGEQRLSVKVDNANFNNQLAPVSFRMLPIKVEGTMECLSDSEVSVPTAPILAPHIEGAMETRLTLIAASEGNNDSTSTVVVSGGQVFVISDTSALSNTTPRTLPQTTESTVTQRVTCREEKRRVSHNEVERRRRDKINSWICKLAKILPDNSESIQARANQSKGGILSKACEHIEALRTANERLTEELLSCERDVDTNLVHIEEIEILKRENNVLRNENMLLRSRLEEHGIILPDLNS